MRFSQIFNTASHQIRDLGGPPKAPGYRKYDDEAFQKDLDRLKYGDSAGTSSLAKTGLRDDNDYSLDVKGIIRTALQIEDESRQLKGRVTGKLVRDEENLY